MKEKILILIIRLVISCFFLKCFSTVVLLYLEGARNSHFLFMSLILYLITGWVIFIGCLLFIFVIWGGCRDYVKRKNTSHSI